MIGSIINFGVYSKTRNDSTTDITFIFDTPSGDLGAYELYRGYNENVSDLVSTKVDTVHSDLTGNSESNSVIKLNNKIYFNYTIPAEDDGKSLYFKVRARSIFHESSSFSTEVVFNNYCSAVSNMIGYYDNFNVALSWEALDLTNQKNSNFKDFVIQRQGVLGVSDIDFDSTDNSFFSPALTLGKFVWVIDSFSRSYWCAPVTTEGYFQLSLANTIIQHKKYEGVVLSVIDDTTVQVSPPLSSKFLKAAAICTVNGISKLLSDDLDTSGTQISLSSTTSILPGQTITITEDVVKINDKLNLNTTINQHNILVYIEDTNPIQIGNVSTNSFIDESYEKGNLYIYKVFSRNVEGVLSLATISPVYTISMLDAVPYLRHPNNSDTGIVQQLYWKSMKNSLIDKNYYLKDRFDIPYLYNKPIHFKGYLGVSKSNLDVFVNDHYQDTIQTDVYGEFDFYFVFPKGESRIKFQARDHQNIDFSRMSATAVINTLNIYTTFGIMGEVLEEYVEELNALREDNNINTARYSSFIPKYAPYIEMYKSGTEDDDDFMELASTVFSAYDYAGYDKSLNMVLEKFLEKTPEFDHYEIYTRNSIYDTITTGRFFVSNNPQLTRVNYYYGVSAVRSTGEETPPSIIRVDSRWWTFRYKGFNSFMWDEVATADYYNIYRGVSKDTLSFLATAQSNIFIDNGTLSEDINKKPYEYNYSGMDIPSNFKVYLRTKLSQIQMLYRKLGNTVIMLFAKDNDVFPELQFTRLTQLFSKLIPPEIRYTVFLVRDSSIYLYPEGRLIEDVSKAVYGKYDHSQYGGTDVYK